MSTDAGPKRSGYHRLRPKIRLGCGLLALLIAVAAIAKLTHSSAVRWSRIRDEQPSDRHAAVPEALLPPDRLADPDIPLADAAAAAGIAERPVPDPRIAVDKSDLELRFYSGTTLLKTYPIALGWGGLEDKVRRGDGRTPEGEFYVCQMLKRRNPKAWSDLFMRLSYPSAEDAERGLRDGIISESERDEIISTIDRRETPPRETDLGSGILIHIGGHADPDWTDGCVAVNRAYGIEIYEQMSIGAPVTIEP